jgi:TPR repeat protein
MNNLAELYEFGRGVTQDNSMAILWYKRAADAGYALAARRLVAVYANGELGESVDQTRARMWSERAQ